jgi:ABC-2 type transport system ATP-binding protein
MITPMVTLTDAAIGTGLGAPLPPLSVTIVDATVTVLAVETQERPLVVSMVLGGRIKLDSGAIEPGYDELRRRTALVDTPFVAEPPAGVPLGIVVAEELSLSGRSGGRAAVSRFLDEHGLAEFEKVDVRALPAVDRIRILSELALERDGVTTLLITSPERHGGLAREWFSYLASLADRGVTVIVVTDAATRDALVSLGAVDALRTTAQGPTTQGPITQEGSV